MATRPRKISIFASLLLLFVLSSALAGAAFGTFSGRVVTKWLGDGRRMELLEDFAFVDPAGVVWKSPRGSVVDGASIPQVAWSIVGGPFEGRYREASVIHDVACDKRERNWEAVHMAFHDAMRARGVGQVRAKVMYAAVYAFGPRWPSVYTEVVGESEVTEKLAALKRQAVENGTIEVAVADHFLEGFGLSGRKEKIATGMKEISVKVTPPSNSLTAKEFDRIRARIEKENLSLGDVRDALGAKR